jgi:hypothetical protein
MNQGNEGLHRPKRLLDLGLPGFAVLHRVVRYESMDAHNGELVGNFTHEFLVAGGV